MKNYKSKLLLILVLTLFIGSCSEEKFETNENGYEVIASFQEETGLVAVYTTNTELLEKVNSWQGKGDYLGLDDWAIAKIPNNFNLLGGLPYQSEFYTINQTILETDTLKVAYWEMLQVKAHPDFGLRDTVGIFEIYENLDTIIVAISKVLANPCYGDGGAWQIYVDDFKAILDTIPIEKIALLEQKNQE